jgi:uncharacterized alpha-E superfamily protein
MLSRVADSLFWMSRYMERADGILRMLKINYASSQDDAQEFSWMPVLKIFSYLNNNDAQILAVDARKVLQYLVTDKNNNGSVVNVVTQARENGRSVQDHITKEMWQCLNEFYHAVRSDKLVDQLQHDDPVTVLDNLFKHCLLYFGTTDVTMSRGEGNAYINIGKFLERAIQSTDVLDIKFSELHYKLDAAADTTYWKYLLLSISGYELYLKTYRGGFEAKNVMEQVLLNEAFPRSVLYSVNRMYRYFERLKNERNIESYNEIEFMMGKVCSKVKFSTAQSIEEAGLPNFLQEIKQSILQIGEALNKNYFALA